MKISVTIITKNEEKNIGRCIDSVKKIADEIIVLDSFSTDSTVEIAMNKGAIVKQQKFNGHIEQKNRALQFASHDFILSLDADEAIDEVLLQSILELKKTGSANAFTMNRLAYFCGTAITHGLWYPDRKLRLFNKNEAIWGGINPHDKILLTKPAKVKRLKGHIVHYSYNSLEHCRQKTDYLTSIYVDSMYKAGKRTNLFKIIVNPVWDFFHGYFLRLGFLDGYFGLIIALHISRTVFIKHMKLYQLQREKIVFAD